MERSKIEHIDESEPFLGRIAALAGPIGETVIHSIMRDADFRRRIERSNPTQITRDLFVKLGVVGPKPYDPQVMARLDSYIEAKAADLEALEQLDGSEEAEILFIENAGIVKEGSAIVSAFKVYREEQMDHWGEHFELRHYGSRIHTALDIGSYVVAETWKQIEFSD